MSIDFSAPQHIPWFPAVGCTSLLEPLLGLVCFFNSGRFAYNKNHPFFGVIQGYKVLGVLTDSYSLCNHLHNQDRIFLSLLKYSRCSFAVVLPPHSAPNDGRSGLFPIVFCLFQNVTWMESCRMYVAFWVWVLSLRVMFLKFIKVVACISSLLLLLSSFQLHGCATICTCTFIKSAKPCSRVAVPFCVSTSNVWQFQLLCILVSIWHWQFFILFEYLVVFCYGFSLYLPNNW